MKLTLISEAKDKKIIMDNVIFSILNVHETHVHLLTGWQNIVNYTFCFPHILFLHFYSKMREWNVEGHLFVKFFTCKNFRSGTLIPGTEWQYRQIQQGNGSKLIPLDFTCSFCSHMLCFKQLECVC